MKPGERILEGIVTTINDDGTVNISPMGPVVDDSMSTLLLRPFNTSTTYANLKRTGQGVLHVTDDVELLARTAVGRLETLPSLRPAEQVTGQVVADACRWYEFQVASIDDRPPRAEMIARVVAVGRGREFFGFNRAMHAVVELAILATRLDFLPADQVQEEILRLTPPIEKTGGERERRAFEFLKAYIRERQATAGSHEK